MLCLVGTELDILCTYIPLSGLSCLCFPSTQFYMYMITVYRITGKYAMLHRDIKNLLCAVHYVPEITICQCHMICEAGRVPITIHIQIICNNFKTVLKSNSAEINQNAMKKFNP